MRSKQPNSYINSDVLIYTQNTLFTSLLDHASTGASPAKLQIKAQGCINFCSHKEADFGRSGTAHILKVI